MITFKANTVPRIPRKTKIVVPTPLYGGSLPIAYHAEHAFRNLGQETILLRLDQQHELYKQCGEAARDRDAKRVLQGTLAVLLADLIAEAAITNSADLVWYTAQSPVSIKSLRLLRSEGVKTAFWFVEDVRRFEYWKTLAPEFDVVFSIQQGEALDELVASGARRVEYLPPAANPEVHRPLDCTPEDRARYGATTAFVGAGYPNRVKLFMLPEFQHVTLWGNDWPTEYEARLQENGRRVEPEETAMIYNATTINLNIHSGLTGTILEQGDFVNPRTFEIAACKAFQIVDRQTPLAELFTDDEVAVISDIRELNDAIRRFKDDSDARSRMSEAAYRRVLAEHTYEHRMRRALDLLGLSSDHSATRVPMPTIADLKAAAYGDDEMQSFLSQFSESSPARLADLVSRIPAGTRDLTKAEMIVLLMNEFRQWGVEKSAIR